MKKNLLILTLVIIAFIGCKKEEDKKVDTFVKITITDNGSSKSGVSVYMFSDTKGPSTAFFKPFHSDKTIITDNNGVATFNLKETFDLEIIDSQTTLYFGVFDVNDNILGQTALTIEKEQTISKTINL